MTECDTDTPTERVLSQEDAVSSNLWLYMTNILNISWMTSLSIASHLLKRVGIVSSLCWTKILVAQAPS
jgi:hypothetical protein